MLSTIWDLHLGHHHCLPPHPQMKDNRSPRYIRVRAKSCDAETMVNPTRVTTPDTCDTVTVRSNMPSMASAFTNPAFCGARGWVNRIVSKMSSKR